MDDLISRQKAIMDAESWVVVDEYEKHLQKNVIEWLKEFPPAELGTDTISRQAAAELVMKYCPDDDGAVQCDGDIRGLLDELENLPSAQPSPQWIPCSERMPEDMQFVLLTVRRLKNEYNPGPFISVGYIGWNHQHWWCAHDGDCEISKVEVIAWMPLPGPYQRGGEKDVRKPD